MSFQFANIFDLFKPYLWGFDSQFKIQLFVKTDFSTC